MGMGEEELKATCEDVFTNKIILTQEGANYFEESRLSHSPCYGLNIVLVTSLPLGF